MSFEVGTKDCTSLSDNELAEMADLSADHESQFDIGFLSKQCEEWVLITTVREGTKLRGYSFCTLERIGGTPSMLIGVASVGPGTAKGRCRPEAPAGRPVPASAAGLPG